jgi:hypothetical protein
MATLQDKGAVVIAKLAPKNYLHMAELFLVGSAGKTGKHRRQEPFLVVYKTYTKPSTFVKYAIKLVGPVSKFKCAEQYAMNNKANQIF